LKTCNFENHDIGNALNNNKDIRTEWKSVVTIQVRQSSVQSSICYDAMAMKQCMLVI